MNTDYTPPDLMPLSLGMRAGMAAQFKLFGCQKI